MSKCTVSVLGLALVIVAACGGKSDSDSAPSNGWSAEERLVFENGGGNSLGVAIADFDHALVVSESDNPSAMPLTSDEDEDAETTDDDDDKAEDDDDGKTTASEAEGDDDEGVAQPTEAEIQKCSDHFGETVKGLQLSGNKATSSIESGDFIAVRLSGNQAAINILLTAKEGEEPTLKGICIVSSGNKPTANVVLNGVSVDKVLYLASGNGAKAHFEVKDNAKIAAFEAKLSGNVGDLIITGGGEYSCEGIKVSGNDAAPKCGADAVTEAQANNEEVAAAAAKSKGASGAKEAAKTAAQ